MARILLLSQDPTIRGGGTRVTSVARRLLGKLGHTCTEAYIASLSHPRLSLARRPGPVHLIEGDGDVRALLAVLPELQVPPLLSGRLALRRLARSESWDQVLVAGASVYHGAAAAGLGLPTSVWGATTIGDERRSQLPSLGPARWAAYRAALPALELFERRVLRGAQHVAGMSPYACTTMERAGDRPVSLLYPTIPLPANVGPDHRRAALAGGRLMCVFVGRVADPRKRFDAVIDVVNQLAATIRPRTIELAVTATPDEVRPYRVVDGVTLRCLGYPEDAELQTIVAGSHWLLLASRQEGFGFVAAEALACGTPVASTRSGGPEAMIADSGGGVVAGVEQLAAAIGAVTDDAWIDMSVRARAFAEKTFSDEQALPAFDALLGR